MPEKTSTSSPSSRRRSSEDRARRLRLICPEDLPGVTLSVARDSAASQPRHAHDSLILGLVTAGARRIETVACCVCVPAGEVFVLPPGQAHACTSGGGTCSYLAFSLSAEVLPAESFQVLPVRVSDAELAGVLERLAEALLSPAGRLERQSLLAEALEHLAAHDRTRREAKPRPGGGDARLAEAVRKAQARLAEDLEPGLSLPALAEVCGLDSYALHRAFTRAVGLPPHAFQTHLRLRRAKELLRAGTPLSEAALQAGFCDQSHMNRHFARLVGVTPAQYAKAHARRA